MLTEGYIDYNECLEREHVLSRGPRMLYRPPPTAYPRQDVGPLMRRLQGPGDEDGKAMVPHVRLDMMTVRNGWFAVGNGLDGVVLTEDRRMVTQMAMFSDPRRNAQDVVDLGIPEAEREFDDVLVGFDAGWTNWYHWLCFALGRSAIGARVLPRECPIVLPDYDARAGRTDIRYSRETWAQSLDVFGLRDRVTLLPPGLYRAKKIRFLWTTPKAPTNLTLFPVFQTLFDAARRVHGRSSESPRRLLISREAAVEKRISPEDTVALNRAAARYGFVRVFFEKMDLREQIDAMFNAEAVMGVHGSGLTNFLFAQKGIKVLEINQPSDGGPTLRPWFYQIAHTRGMAYRFLNAGVGEVTERRLAAALRSLGLNELTSSHPT